MAHSVLGSVTLGYQPVWNQWRKRCGVRLLVDTVGPTAVNAQHLLKAITELWPGCADRMLLMRGVARATGRSAAKQCIPGHGH
jgi:c-di-GMP phosphodiesterase